MTPTKLSRFVLTTFCTAVILTAFVSCTRRAEPVAMDTALLEELTAEIALAETNDDLEKFISFYDTAAIAMPEFQPTLVGIGQIRSFYKAIFARQNITTFEKKPDEFIALDSAVVEIGKFTKSYTAEGAETATTLQGKYCRIWGKSSNDEPKIRAETYGFFHGVDHEEPLVVRDLITPAADNYREHEIPLELRAYNALMEKYVHQSGSGTLRAEFFMDDGKFFPFAHEPVSGMNEIKPYLTAYDTRGPGFEFDTVSVWTFRYEYHGEYILEYPRFFVRWSAPGAQGGASGQGIRLWKRQPDYSLKLYREMGTHNFE